MGDPFNGASWSMGYGPEAALDAPIRPPDVSGVDIPARDRDWWETQLAPSISDGLTDLVLQPVDAGDVFWGATGAHAGRRVLVRLPRGLERRGSEPIVDEVLTVVVAELTPPEKGSWVIESPAKWFRGRRAWALNRPPVTIGDPWFDHHAASWAWDCANGLDDLRTALRPILPAVRSVLMSHPGVTVTNSAIRAWIPHSEVPARLASLLVETENLGAGTTDR